MQREQVQSPIVELRSQMLCGLTKKFFKKFSWSLFYLPDCFGEGNGNPSQYSCLGNPMDRGAGQATVQGVTKSQTRLSNWAAATSSLQHGAQRCDSAWACHVCVCACDVLGAASCFGVQIHPHCRWSWRGENGISRAQVKYLGWELAKQQYPLPRQPWRLNHLTLLLFLKMLLRIKASNTSFKV